MSTYEKMLNTYNDLASNYTSEELEQLKNIIIQNQNNKHINSDTILIRILSLAESSKYLENGDCNGSITKNSKNVWNDTVGNKNITVLRDSVFYHSSTTNDIIMLTQNNEKQNFMPRCKSWFLDWKYQANSASWRTEKHYIPNSLKAKTNINDSVVWSSDVGQVTFTFNINIGFRPVFNYMDNNKSENIYR